MKITNKRVKLHTKEQLQFIDITDEVLEFVSESGVQNGLINIQTLHTTTGVIVNENEPLLIEDMKVILEKTASQEHVYTHDDFSIRTVNMCDDECANGHAHCKAIHLSTNVTLNLVEGRPHMGTWQRIIFIELDRSRPREYSVTVMGE